MTDIKWAGLRAVAADGKALGVKIATLRALARNGYIRDTSAGNEIAWEITSHGRVLLGEITDAPADGPQQPADLFACFPADPEDF